LHNGDFEDLDQPSIKINKYEKEIDRLFFESVQGTYFNGELMALNLSERIKKLTPKISQKV
jgi:hypothetical protein